MGHDEIEQYLQTKIKDTIKNNEGEPKNLWTKYYSFKDEFNSLLTDLSSETNRKVKGDWLSVKRYNLYSLNNLVTEWQVIRNHASFTHKEVYEASENIKKGLRRIKKEINSEESSSRGDYNQDGSSTTHRPHQDPNYPIFERRMTEVYRWSSLHAPRTVHGFEHRTLAVVRDLVLRDSEAPFKVFGVVGTTGIGKTTLCQDIFRQDLVKQHFSPRIWVCLSKQPRYRNDNYKEEVVVRMLKCLGIEDEIINNANELKKLILLLRLQLIGKRYLIVLDDAWSDDEFFFELNEKDRLDENWGEELAYGLPKGCGGTVISSSTSDTLLKKMLGNDVRLQFLEPLTKDIIDSIFADAVIGYDDDEREFPSELDQMVKELVNKCDGVPLAAKLLAKIALKNLEIMTKSEKNPTTGVEGGRDEK